MNRPSFQFYTKDWRSNSKLRRCSPAARGVWIDILCALHDSDQYGIARYRLRELASEVGASLAHVKELVDKGVLKGSDTQLDEAFVYVPRSGRKDGAPVTLIPVQAGPIWYSSRMVKDEYVNTKRGEGTRFGEAPKASPPPSPSRREGDGPSSASAFATALKEGGIPPPRPSAAPSAPASGPGDTSEESPPPTPGLPAYVAMRAAGVSDGYASHPDLLRLVDAGVGPPVFGAVAAQLAGKGKGRFALVLATVEGQLRDAAAKGAAPPPASDAQTWRKSDSGIRAMAAQLQVRHADGDTFEAWDRRVFTAWQRAGQPAPKEPT